MATCDWYICTLVDTAWVYMPNDIRPYGMSGITTLSVPTNVFHSRHSDISVHPTSVKGELTVVKKYNAQNLSQLSMSVNYSKVISQGIFMQVILVCKHYFKTLYKGFCCQKGVDTQAVKQMHYYYTCQISTKWMCAAATRVMREWLKWPIACNFRLVKLSRPSKGIKPSL